MKNRTPLYHAHVELSAKMVDFSGWEMPLHYGSQLSEHHEVRQNAGIFDVSHMGILDIKGIDANAYLSYLLANNINKLTPGKALYSCMLNESGGVIDDIVIYQLSASAYRMIVNAGTRAKDLLWMQTLAKRFSSLTLEERTDLAMIAVQGPKVKELIPSVFSNDAVSEKILSLKPFSFIETENLFIARTGYTGEDGFEIICPNNNAENIWRYFIKAGAKPCGLGARDTLRLEAGLNLYGSDMDETVTPLESNLSWTVALEPKDRQFSGRAAIEQLMQMGIKRKLVGLVLNGPGVIRNHQKIVIENNGFGEVTSGGYSPTLERSIALARIPILTNDECFIEIRQKLVPARIVKPPFVRYGKNLVNL